MTSSALKFEIEEYEKFSPGSALSNFFNQNSSHLNCEELVTQLKSDLVEKLESERLKESQEKASLLRQSIYKNTNGMF